jgi:GTP diphosphokinase / guanosine-3',5'-bis(diphosphate) 3'-diphosphatase
MSRLNITIKDILKASQDRSDSAYQLIRDAWDFAEKAHGDQKRLSGEPYLNHPAIVALLLAKAGMDKVTIAAGLLHDTLEDTKITYQDLKENFGEDVACLVKGVTKIGGLKYDEKRKQAGNLRNLFIAAAQDIRVIIIKLFDRLHNLETLEYHDKARQKRKAIESLEIYAPIAYRLGMRTLRVQIEDLSFLNLHPKKYKKVADFKERRLKETEESIKDTTESIKKGLKKNKIKFNIEVIKKGVYSLFKKIKRIKNNDLTVLHDLTPIRIIVEDIPSCYQSMGVIHTQFKPLPNKINDFISFPKPNGYQALHTSIFTGKGEVIEVQIMTEKMNCQANMGVACNFCSQENKTTFFNFSKQLFSFSNKKNIEKYQTFKKVPAWFKDMVSRQKDMKNPNEFFNNLSKDFFNYRILVFTPKGDVVNLPSDSSPIDFAYYISPTLGNHLKTAEVDGEKVSINTKLKNGNIVEITTSPSATPSSGWLRYVKTTFAKKQIRSFLKKNKR